MASTLVRPSRDRWIGGVCSGLARRVGMSSNTMRLIFVISCLLPRPQFLIYILLWILMPSEDCPRPPVRLVPHGNLAVHESRQVAPGGRDGSRPAAHEHCC